MIEKIETQIRMESFYYAENNFGGDYRCIDSNRRFPPGGLQSEMDRLFNEMSNTTLPGVHESQRRGVFTGGRYTVKSRIYEQNLVSFTPPSWKAGCGGVDMFGGSFSFINAEQLVTMMRAVAANAKGYAFQLALDNVFRMERSGWRTFRKRFKH